MQTEILHSGRSERTQTTFYGGQTACQLCMECCAPLARLRSVPGTHTETQYIQLKSPSCCPLSTRIPRPALRYETLTHFVAITWSQGNHQQKPQLQVLCWHVYRLATICISRLIFPVCISACLASCPLPPRTHAQEWFCFLFIVENGFDTPPEHSITVGSGQMP